MVFTVYCIYCGLTYFIPFLNQIYFLPATAVGMYGIINQYGLKMVERTNPGGFMSDKVTNLLQSISAQALWYVSLPWSFS